MFVAFTNAKLTVSLKNIYLWMLKTRNGYDGPNSSSEKKKAWKVPFFFWNLFFQQGPHLQPVQC